MTQVPANVGSVLRFQDWEVHPAERILVVRGEVAALGSRAFDVLFALAQRPGQVVSKDDLLAAAWPGLVVEENNVSVQIASLRKLLGPRAISTVAGIGYQLSATEGEAGLPSAASAPTYHSALTSAAKGGLGLTDLVGRDADVDAVVELLDTHAIVSILGTGGVGKTSLAKAVLARRMLDRHDDVWWIDLAPIRDATQLIAHMADTLSIDLGGSVDVHEDLIDALASVQAVIAIDNCEHLISELTHLVRRSTDRASGLRWLATSQAPLHISGEVTYRLEPLNVPALVTSVEQAMGYGAIALLSRRAKAAHRHFEINDGNVGIAIALCRQLDGLPLAIEMAAARVATLGLHGVHDQLGHRLQLLAGPRDSALRHHSLRSMFDWSHALLSSVEQKVFRRLVPFLGTFNAAMAQQLAADDEGLNEISQWEVLEALSALVDRSLLNRLPEVPGRYFLFESARDYARQKLDEAAESASLRARHAEVVVAWFRKASADFANIADDQLATRYVVERHNVSAALDWAIEAQDPDILASLVAALGQIDSFAQSQPEIIQRAIPMQAIGKAKLNLRAAAYLELSWAHYADGSREIATDLAKRALADYQALPDTAGEYRALAQLVRLYHSRPGLNDEAQHARSLLENINDAQIPLRTRLSCAIVNCLFYGSDRSVAQFEELERIARAAGYAALAAVCRVHITNELLIEARFEAVVDSAQQYLDAGESRPRVRGLILGNQALALVQLERTVEAREPARAALRALPSSAHTIIDTFALAAARENKPVDAALMTGYGARVRRERDEDPDPAEAAAIEETLRALRQQLTAERLDELMQLGSLMSTSDLVALALPT